MEKFLEFFERAGITLGVVLFIGIISIPFFAFSCFLCDWSLAQHLWASVKSSVFKMSVLNNLICFSAGILATMLWVKFSKSAKEKIQGIRDIYFYPAEEVKVTALCFLTVFSVGAIVSWRLDKLGLKLLPDGSSWWSWSSLANTLASQLIGVIVLLAVMFVVECFKRTKRRKHVYYK